MIAHPADRYIYHVYILKLRMIECRRIMLSDHSLFHFEYACLQWRKIIEGLSQSWIIAAEIDGLSVSDTLKKSNKPLAIFNKLKKNNKFMFPQPVRFTWGERDNDGPAQHLIEGIGTPLDAARKIVDLYEKSHKFLHSINPYHAIPLGEALSDLNTINFRGLLVDTRDIWNNFWQHSICVKDEALFINLGSDTENELPQVIRTTGINYNYDGIELLNSTTNICGWSNFPDWRALRTEI